MKFFLDYGFRLWLGLFLAILFSLPLLAFSATFAYFFSVIDKVKLGPLFPDSLIFLWSFWKSANVVDGRFYAPFLQVVVFGFLGFRTLLFVEMILRRKFYQATIRKELKIPYSESTFFIELFFSYFYGNAGALFLPHLILYLHNWLNFTSFTGLSCFIFLRFLPGKDWAAAYSSSLFYAMHKMMHMGGLFSVFHMEHHLPIMSSGLVGFSEGTGLLETFTFGLPQTLSRHYWCCGCGGLVIFFFDELSIVLYHHYFNYPRLHRMLGRVALTSHLLARYYPFQKQSDEKKSYVDAGEILYEKELVNLPSFLKSHGMHHWYNRRNTFGFGGVVDTIDEIVDVLKEEGEKEKAGNL
jgi:hypothetical protein